MDDEVEAAPTAPTAHITEITDHRARGDNDTRSPIPSSSRAVALASIAEASSDEKIKGDAEFLDQLKLLLENHKTSTLFMPFYLQIKATYHKGRKSLKKRLLCDNSLLAKISASTPDETSVEVQDQQEHVGNSLQSQSEPEAMDTDDEESDTDENNVSNLQQPALGNYCLITNGQNNLPATIVCLDPLAVRYFQLGPRNMFRACDYEQEILREDIAQYIEDPETIQQGSRIYYKFNY